LADHYDVYLKKDNNPCSRTVCSHYDLDAREYMSQSDRPVPYAPHGAVDGIVCDTTLALNMSFIGRFGNSCGIPFYKDKYCKENIQFSNICYFLKDRPSQPWTKFQVHNFDKQSFDKYLNSIKKFKNSYIAETIKAKGEAPLELKFDKNINYFTMDKNNNIDRKYFTDDNINYIPTNSIIERFPTRTIIKDNDKFFNKQTKALKKNRQLIKTRKNKAFNKTKKTKKTKNKNNNKQ
jgi:hypothetical protein